MNNLPKLDLTRLDVRKLDVRKFDVRKLDLPKVAARVDVRKAGRLLALLLSLSVVVFLYSMVLTRGGILR